MNLLIAWEKVQFCTIFHKKLPNCAISKRIRIFHKYLKDKYKFKYKNRISSLET